MTPLEALQAALAGEHAAVYCYGVIGARTSASAHPDLYDAMLHGFQRHRRRRDQLTAMIVRRGAEPVAAEVSYEVPGPLRNVPELNNAALQLERRIARTFGQLVESTAGAERRWALVALDDAAVRQVEFRGTPEMFPGSSSSIISEDGP
ncbi:MAG: ferritin-like domain-containing protein [Nocardioidaceae bacterium]|nr:ferritin-like domain-containing protein [Nocardioidaceae bacterium]